MPVSHPDDAVTTLESFVTSGFTALTATQLISSFSAYANALGQVGDYVLDQKSLAETNYQTIVALATAATADRAAIASDLTDAGTAKTAAETAQSNAEGYETTARTNAASLTPARLYIRDLKGRPQWPTAL